MSDLVTPEEVRELLDYDPETGVFRWRCDGCGKRRAGAVAGCTKGKGYRKISISSRGYMAHRLAWLITHDRWPADQIDHINGIRDDNRIANLREATNAQNLQNLVRNGSKYGTGVYLTPEGRYLTQITLRGRRINVGTFLTVEAARAAYAEAKRKYHTFSPESRKPSPTSEAPASRTNP